MRAVALGCGNDERYQAITEDLGASLVGLVGGERLGETFTRRTTNPMRRNAPVVYDVSAIDDSERDLQAATLLACWSAGFRTVNVANVLADTGLEPCRHYFVVLDELWRPLRAGRGMVDRVSALTRLNRQRGITDVCRWLTRPADETEVEIRHAHGSRLTAHQVASVVDEPDKQRCGVFGTAQQMASACARRRWDRSAQCIGQINCLA
ncbi:hypothetical protein [Microbacterium proteolyticum]|uniref:hypothetical protein n=1 Tax=Microbacterium proteolyticum TaxID=1572644 RepID=UPI0035A91D4E|nr:hypothetical protein [Microbacterium proteolyticum]